MRSVFIGAIALLLVAGIYFWINDQGIGQDNPVTLVGPTGCEFHGSPELNILKEGCLYALGIDVPVLQSYVLKEIFKAVIELDEQSQEEKIPKLFSNPLIQAEVIQNLAVRKAIIGQFKEALKLAHTIQNLEWRNYTIRKIAVLKAKKGDFEGAYQVAMGIKERTPRANALREIVLQKIQIGDFGSARKIAESIDEPYRKRRTLVEIERSKQRQAQLSQNPVGNGHRISLRSRIKKPGKIVEFREIAPETQAQAKRANFLRSAARVQAQQGDLSGAFETIGSIKGPFFKSRALVDIASIVAKQGDTTSAWEIAESIQTPSPRVDAFLNIGLTHKNHSGESLGKKALDRAFYYAKQITNSEIRDELLSEVSLAQLEIGDEKGIQYTTDSIRDQNQKDYVLRSIRAMKSNAKGLLDYERFIEKLRSIDSIQVPIEKAESLRQVAKQWKGLIAEEMLPSREIKKETKFF